MSGNIRAHAKGVAKVRAFARNLVVVLLATGLVAWLSVMAGGVKEAEADDTVLAQIFENHPQGGATLADAEYTVDFYGGYFDEVADAEASGEHLRHWTFKTDAHGQVLLNEDYLTGGDALYYDLAENPVLPLGTYLIRETKAPAGYNLDSQTVFLRQVTANNKLEHVTTYSTPEHEEQVKRGDVQLTKAREDSQERMSGIPFLLTSLTTGETHVLVTDDNGEFRSASSWEPHTKDTNGNDAAVTGYRIVQDVNGLFRPDVTDVVVDESALDVERGVWFGVSEPKDDHGAVIYDDYTLVELPVTASEGMTMVTMPKLTVARDAYEIDLGTIDNQFETDEYLWTEVRDAHDGDKFVAADPEAHVVDRCELFNLLPDYEYVLHATLMDKASGEAVIGADGDAVGGTLRFTAKAALDERDVDIEFDSLPLAGGEYVVFETLYQVDLITGEELEVAHHTDIDDYDQTIAVTVPSEVTELVDRKSGTHTITADPEAELDAEVDYRNLVPGLEYEVTGKLYTIDPGTGEKVPVTDKDGNPVVSTVKTTPTGGDGHVTVPFDAVDTSHMVDREVFVETVIERVGREICSDDDPDDVIGHPGDGKPGDPESPATPGTPTYPDPDDPDGGSYVQTGDKVDRVRGAKLATTLTSTGAKPKVIVADSEAGATDSVAIEGLVPGYEYELVSVLVDRDTGLPVVNAAGASEKRMRKFSDALFAAMGLAGVDGTFDPAAGAWTRYPAQFDEAGVDAVVSNKRFAGLGENLMWARTAFTAKSASQTVDVSYRFDARETASENVTACTMLVQKKSGLLVAGDLDLSLESQSATIVHPAIDTVATDASDGDKYVMNGASAQVRDRIQYEDFVPGKEYVVVTTVRHASDGSQAYVADEPIRAETRFVPAAASGKFDAFVSFDARHLEDHDLVVYEEVYRDMNIGSDKAERVLVAEHCDANDADQRFSVEGNGTFRPDGGFQIGTDKKLTRLEGGSGMNRLGGGLGALAVTGGDDSDAFAKTSARDTALPMAAILCALLAAGGVALAVRDVRRKDR